MAIFHICTSCRVRDICEVRRRMKELRDDLEEALADFTKRLRAHICISECAYHKE